jgi:hypothetical protein
MKVPDNRGYYGTHVEYKWYAGRAKVLGNPFKGGERKQSTVTKQEESHRFYKSKFIRNIVVQLAKSV